MARHRLESSVLEKKGEGEDLKEILLIVVSG